MTDNWIDRGNVDTAVPAPEEANDVPAPDDGPGVRPVRLAVLAALVVMLWFGGGPAMTVVVAAILLMIFMHELGHYLTARWAGMKVTEFFIGFGPRIASFRRGETEYGIKAIPAGAYVRIIGMNNLDETPLSDESRTYRQQPYLRRLVVASAGSAMHFFLAVVLLFVVVTTVGLRADGWSVGAVVEGSAAAAAGLRPGDVVERIGDAVVEDDHADVAAAAARYEGEQVEIVFRRDGQTRSARTRITTATWVLAGDGGRRSGDFRVVDTDGGFAIFDSDGGGNESGSLLAEAGIESGDRITAINGVELRSSADVDHAIQLSEGGTVGFRLADGDADIVVDFGDQVAADPPKAFVGVAADPAPRESVGVGEGISTTAELFGRSLWTSVQGVGKVLWPPNLLGFVGDTAGVSDDSRPSDAASASALAREMVADVENRPVSLVGVVRLSSDSINSDGWSALLGLMVQLNIVIGVFNLLPLPPLDGGHIAVATYEKVRELMSGRPGRYFVDYGKLLPVTYTVVVLLALLGSFSLIADIRNPIQI